jgi:DNA primase
MARITDSSKEKVREATDIVELVNHYTDLRRNGAQYMGRCPFHEDNSPSFSVNPADKVYYCFGCEARGDLFTFVMEKESLDFAGAVEFLADRYNVELEYEELDPRAAERQKQRERLHELLERATKFYVRTLADAPEAGPAREYLAARGFSPEVLARFRIGYAPKAWDKLFVPALRQGFSERELLDAGLVQLNKDNRIYDRFRGRIMFPLADKKGIVRGFGARGMRDSDVPKYLNSPEGPVYHKGSQIFGIDHARRPAAAKKRVIAVEGYADVLALHDAGFEEAVAVMGTAMTEQQATELARMAQHVYLALDADESGRRAALRAAEVLGAHRDTETLVIQIPEGKDPDELIRSGGAQAFEQAIAAAVTVAEFAVAQVFAGGDLATARGREHVLDDLVPVFAAMVAGPVREEQLRLAADRLGISDAVLRESIRERSASAPRAANVREPGPAEAPAPARKAVRADPLERPERIFFAQCLSNPAAGTQALGRLSDDDLSTPLMCELRDHLLENAENPLAKLPELKPELQSAVTEVAMLSEREHASAEVIQIGFLQLEKAGLDRKIAGAPGAQKAEIELRRQEVIRRIGELSAEFA